jgi:hypothetical protein
MTPPNVTMVAPSTVAPGSTVFLPDGSSTTVSAAGTASIPAAYISIFLNAGWDLSPASSLPLASGHILVGDSSNQAADVAMTGDVAIDNAGATSIPTTKLATSENSYIRTDVGTKDLLAAAAAARKVMIVVTVTTAFANGDGAQPTLTIGEESGSATKFAAAAKFTGAAAGATFVFAGILTSAKKLQAVLVAATGSTSTGAYTIDVIAVG